MVLGELDSNRQKVETRPLSHTIHKNKLKMDKEDVVYINNGILLDNQKEWDLDIYNNVDGTRGYYAKWN